MNLINTRVYARIHGHSKHAVGAEIHDLYNPDDIYGITDKFGCVSFELKGGTLFTPVLEGKGLIHVQSASHIIPQNGFETHETELFVQTAPEKLYQSLCFFFNRDKKPGCADIVTTVCPPGVNLRNDQGFVGARVWLETEDGERLDIDPVYVASTHLNTRWTKTGTNWLTPFFSQYSSFLQKYLQNDRTSSDGGVFFRNVPPGRYHICAEKDGVIFNKSELVIVDADKSPGVIIVPPGHGPRVQSAMIQPDVLHPTITTGNLDLAA